MTESNASNSSPDEHASAQTNGADGCKASGRPLTSPTDAARDTVIRAIAHRELGIKTLERRMSDALDFHDIAVWSVEAALTAAYESGRLAGTSTEPRRQAPTHCQCPACGRDIEITPLS